MANMAGLNRTIEDTDTDPMADESVELTEGQKACLRLVDDHMTSKEIGRFLGISHFTVDQRLDAARRKLNAATRKDAAKIFAAIEQRTISEPFVYETQDLERGQYGASQSAVIAAIPVLRFSGNPGLSRQSMAGRLSVAHGSVRERELAAGVRWRPVARIPVQVIAERRFRENRPDAFAPRWCSQGRQWSRYRGGQAPADDGWRGKRLVRGRSAPGRHPRPPARGRR